MTWTWVLTVASIVGVILNIKKRRACFYVWAVTNAAWAIVDFWKGLPAQGVLFSVYFVLALYGLWEWRKGPVTWSVVAPWAKRVAAGAVVVALSFAIVLGLMYAMVSEVELRELKYTRAWVSILEDKALNEFNTAREAGRR